MGLLHRLFSRRMLDVWRAEVRLLHRLGYVRPPEAVQWISTGVCDLTCPHCYSHAGRRRDGELCTDEARRLIIDELVRLDRPTLVLAGGEPTLRTDFAQFIAHAHRRGVPWSMHTHGGRIARLMHHLRQHPPVMVAVSLDGPRPYHDRFRGRRGSFDTAVDAIGRLKGIGGFEVVAGTTVTRDNADLLADMLPIVRRSGADSWGLHLMTPEGRASAHRDRLATPRQLRRVAGFARRLRSIMHIELDNEWGSAGDDDCFYRDRPFMCGAGRISCVVTAAGEVVPCTTTDIRESSGNVRDKPLSRIWAEGFGTFRGGADPLRSEVLDCWLQTRHGHSCRRAAFWADDAAALPTAGHGAEASANPVTLTVGATS